MILGIDVGVGGAVAVLTETGEYCEVFDLPTQAGAVGKKARTVINARELYQRFFMLNCTREKISIAYVERIHATPINGSVATFSQGHSLGTITAALAIGGVPYVFVPAHAWKKELGLDPKADKEVSRGMAIRLYPTAPLDRKKDHDRAEALLLATYGLSRQRKGVGVSEASLPPVL